MCGESAVNVFHFDASKIYRRKGDTPGVAVLSRKTFPEYEFELIYQWSRGRGIRLPVIVMVFENGYVKGCGGADECYGDTRDHPQR